MKQVKDLFKAIKKNLNASAMAMYGQYTNNIHRTDFRKTSIHHP